MTLGKNVRLVATTSAIALAGCTTTKEREGMYLLPNDYSNRIVTIVGGDNDIEYLFDRPSKDSNEPELNYVLPEVTRSAELIGVKELGFFADFFNLNNQPEIVLKIKTIQKNLGLKVDGVIGKTTLKYLYTHYYAHSDKLPFDISKRLDIYNSIQGYKTHPGKYSRHGKVYPGSLPDIFSNDYYYGEGAGENFSGTYINEKLYSNFNNKIDSDGLVAYLVNIDGKFAVGLYLDGDLKVLSYTSPGNPNLTGSVSTTLGEFTGEYSNEHHISSAKASIKTGADGVTRGAVMPYAVHVVNGIFSHAGRVNGYRRSHGCIRLPALYANGVYEYKKKYGDIKWIIKDN